MEQARVAMCHAFGLRYKQAVSSTIPFGVWTIPEVASVGLSEADARSLNLAAHVRSPFAPEAALDLDFVGNDTTYYIANIMFDEFHEKRFAAPPLLKRMVQAGLNGRKAGRGFYEY